MFYLCFVCLIFCSPAFDQFCLCIIGVICVLAVFPGVVVPVGGTREGDHAEIPIVPGDSFLDGPSGKLVRVHSGLVSGGRVKPSAGGYQSLLDATVLACEARAVDMLREYKEAVHAAGRISLFVCFSFFQFCFYFLEAVHAAGRISLFVCFSFFQLLFLLLFL